MYGVKQQDLKRFFLMKKGHTAFHEYRDRVRDRVSEGYSE